MTAVFVGELIGVEAIQDWSALVHGASRPVRGRKFEHELNNLFLHIGPDVLLTANDGPGTKCSNFLNIIAATPRLNDKSTVLGQVVDVMEVVEKIVQVRTGAGKNSREDVFSNYGIHARSVT